MAEKLCLEKVVISQTVSVDQTVSAEITVNATIQKQAIKNVEQEKKLLLNAVLINKPQILSTCQEFVALGISKYFTLHNNVYKL
jgi:hypothetical protein